MTDPSASQTQRRDRGADPDSEFAPAKCAAEYDEMDSDTESEREFEVSGASTRPRSWRRCALGEVCTSKSKQANLIVCSTCSFAAHAKCMDLNRPPRGKAWYCPKCTAEHRERKKKEAELEAADRMRKAEAEAETRRRQARAVPPPYAAPPAAAMRDEKVATAVLKMFETMPEIMKQQQERSEKREDKLMANSLTWGRMVMSAADAGAPARTKDNDDVDPNSVSDAVAFLNARGLR